MDRRRVIVIGYCVVGVTVNVVFNLGFAAGWWLR